MTSRRTSANIHDYPEHLNPFYEEDQHNRLRFWTDTKKKSRSNSFSFQSIKDFRGSIRLPRRSRNRADTSSSLSQLNCLGTTPKSHSHTIQSSASQSHNDNKFYSTLRKLSRTFSIRNKNRSNTNNIDQSSPTENDVEIRVRPTERLSAAPLPLPRSRFQSRIRKTDSGSNRTLNADPDSDLDDKNPFSNDNDDEETQICKPVTPIRKKKKAPPPPVRHSSLKANTFAEYQASKQNVEVSTNHAEDITNDNTDLEVKVEQVVILNTSDENNTNDSSKKEETSNEEHKVDIETKEANIDKEIKDRKDNSNSEDNNYNEVTGSKDDSNNEDNTDIPNAESCIIYNTEVTLQTLTSPEENAEDASDLVDLVNKLQKEVEKLIDDTNNNIIENEEERKIRNIRSWIPLDNHKTEMNNHYQDDDDDVVSAPMSPRLVRLRQDSDWIRPQQ